MLLMRDFNPCLPNLKSKIAGVTNREFLQARSLIGLVTVALLVTGQRKSHPLHRDMYQLQQQILELVPDQFAPGIGGMHRGILYAG